MSDILRTGTDLTGNEELDLQAMVASAVKEHLKDAAGGTLKQDANAGGPTPYKVKVFGQEQTFESPEAASRAIEAALVQVRDAAFQQAQAAASEGTKIKKEDIPAGSGFSREEFAARIEKDPLEGLDYALGHLLFNGKVDKASQALQAQLQDLQSQKQVFAAYQFREMYPMFPGDPNSIQRLDAIRNELELPPDKASSWEAAYNVAISRNMLPSPAQIAAAQEQRQQQQPQQYAGPPSLGRAAHEPPPSWLAQAEELSVEQLEAILAKAGSSVR